MKPRTLLALLLALSLFLPLSASAESFSGSLVISNGGNINGTLYFTALAPGETTSGYAPLTGLSVTASGDYTYVYRLVNNSMVSGLSDGFGDYNNFTDLDLVTLLDPDGPFITGETFQAGSGEEPSFIDTTTTNFDIDYQFDDGPNFGIVPGGGNSAFLYFRSSLGPTNQGGAIITNNRPSQESASVNTGVTTPMAQAVPEPATLGLLAAGLIALRRKRV